jgi:uncharacterized delta-60 repeat protein
MKPSMALRLSGNPSAPTGSLRGIIKGIGEQSDPPRAWMELLEPRQMLTAAPIMAATISLDRHFGHHGYADAALPWHDGRAVFMEALGLAPGGKIYAAATVFSPNEPLNKIVLARFNPDGKPDQTFANQGVLITSVGGGYDEIGSIRVQRDGKLLVIASVNFQEVDLLRYNSDGTPDVSFGANGRAFVAEPRRPGFDYNGDNPLGFYNEVLNGWVQRDGKIVAIYHDVQGLGIVRLNTNGTPDKSFAPGGIRLLSPIPKLNTRDPWFRASGDFNSDMVTDAPMPDGTGVFYFLVTRHS